MQPLAVRRSEQPCRRFSGSSAIPPVAPKETGSCAGKCYWGVTIEEGFYAHIRDEIKRQVWASAGVQLVEVEDVERVGRVVSKALALLVGRSGAA